MEQQGSSKGNSMPSFNYGNKIMPSYKERKNLRKRMLRNVKGKQRVVVENISPEIDGGIFFIKRAVGENVVVEADIFCDGHDDVCADVLYRRAMDDRWRRAPMRHIEQGMWRGKFVIESVDDYYYTVEGWVNQFKTWQQDLKKRLESGQDISVDLKVGVQIIEKIIKGKDGEDISKIKWHISGMQNMLNIAEATNYALSEDLLNAVVNYRNDESAGRYPKQLKVHVDRKKALFSSWYELFPRSFDPDGVHGSFKDVEMLLPEIQRMGFDVLYFPPIHPIGHTKRKGKNNSPDSQEGDPGSPWAIGSEEGGHKAINPALGTMEDFVSFVKKAKDFDMEVALDLAFQCSPDHPYVKDHPEWFTWRPDGTIQYAENPPKKYEDVLPINFLTDHWRELWDELRSIVFFWVDRGVRIFRVDNPHTKPFAFWQWLIPEVRRVNPEVIFLSEAFTEPKVMKRLAKVGFTQSYTYFTWRNTKHEFIEYLNELTQTEMKEYFRPNFWPNTPDILPFHLQEGGRPAFIARLVLAATLSSNFGIYGPAYELCEAQPVLGKEEYLHSEKYEFKYWDWNKWGNLKDLIATVNRLRKENPALHSTNNIKFCDSNNENVLCYYKATEDNSNIVFVAVNLDFKNTQETWIDFPIWDVGINQGQPYKMIDLMDGSEYIWKDQSNYIQLNPDVMPAHIFHVQRM